MLSRVQGLHGTASSTSAHVNGIRIRSGLAGNIFDPHYANPDAIRIHVNVP